MCVWPAWLHCSPAQRACRSSRMFGGHGVYVLCLCAKQIACCVPGLCLIWRVDRRIAMAAHATTLVKHPSIHAMLCFAVVDTAGVKILCGSSMGPPFWVLITLVKLLALNLNYKDNTRVL